MSRQQTKKRSYETFESDAGFGQREKSNIQHFDHDIARLLEEAKSLSESIQRLKKSQKDIKRKELKEERGGKSKFLQNCKEKYEEEYNATKDCAEKIIRILDKDVANRRSKERSSSWNPPSQKQRVHLPTSQCFNCQLLQDQMKETQRSLDQVLGENDRIQAQIKQLQQQLADERNKTEDTLRRFSELASSKLRDNNPNIADLSDQNRPTKIAEKMSELYDNQWTDAFDALATNRSEESIIQELLSMLMNVFETCRCLTEGFFERLQECIELPRSPIGDQKGSRPRDSKVALPDQLRQQAKEFRRVRAMTVMKEVEQLVLDELQLTNKSPEIRSYLSVCVVIGWLAAVQDPPLVLQVCSAGVQFNTNMFKDYTKRGPYVEFVVWPALLLHANGPLLSKGVAQGCQSPSKGRSPNEMPPTRPSRDNYSQSHKKTHPYPVDDYEHAAQQSRPEHWAEQRRYKSQTRDYPDYYTGSTSRERNVGGQSRKQFVSTRQNQTIDPLNENGANVNDSWEHRYTGTRQKRDAQSGYGNVSQYRNVNPAGARIAVNFGGKESHL